MDLDPDIAPFFDVTNVYCGLVFCDACNAEAKYTSQNPMYCDANYYDQALAMKRQGWTVTDDLRAFCPACSKQRS
jgi:hypothetical protein